mmetsp:Transcript_146049/g.406904  ORF Transcript_146049/g.406904 Transcript_146049/m.406904 type:complete len:87 (+) Transcript_146049:106-366(+)
MSSISASKRIECNSSTTCRARIGSMGAQEQARAAEGQCSSRQLARKSFGGRPGLWPEQAAVADKAHPRTTPRHPAREDASIHGNAT